MSALLCSADEMHHLYQISSGSLRLDERVVDVHIWLHASLMHLVKLRGTGDTIWSCASCPAPVKC